MLRARASRASPTPQLEAGFGGPPLVGIFCIAAVAGSDQPAIIAWRTAHGADLADLVQIDGVLQQEAIVRDQDRCLG